MLHFHLTRYWFDRFKSGLKTVEYRPANARNSRILKNAFDKYGAMLSCALCCVSCRIPCKLYCGNPKADDVDRVISCYVVGVALRPLSRLPEAEKEFFIACGIDDPKTLFYAISLEV